MRFVIYGAGAIGSLLGAYLAKAAYDTILIGREAHVSKIKQTGLKIRTSSGSFVVSLPAVVRPSDIEYQPDDIVLLATKSEDTEEAVNIMAQCAPGDVALVCCQNSVRNEEIVSRSFTNVYGCVVFFSGTYLAPGEIAYTLGERLGLGVYPSGINETARRVYQALKAAGFGAFLHESIMAVKWSKLVLNLSMAVNAITGLSGAESRASKEPREFIADVLDEGVKAIQAAGIVFGDEPGQPSVADLGARMRAMTDSVPPLSIPEEMKHRPSLWQDIALKRGKTEIDFINGEIVELGKKLGMATPLNSLMVEVVRKMAQERALPGKYSIADLRRMLDS